MERVAKQPDSGIGTMPIVYPPDAHSVYLFLEPGVYDLIISWDGRAQVRAFHLWNRNMSQKVEVVNLGAETVRKQRRGFARVSSEVPQWVYFHSSGVVDAGARLAVQAIPASLTFDFEVTTT